MSSNIRKNSNNVVNHQNNITSSITDALSENIILHNEILKKLEEISKLKVQNRLNASKVLTFIQHSWESIDSRRSDEGIVISENNNTRVFWRKFTSSLDDARKNGNDNLRIKRKRGRYSSSADETNNYKIVKKHWEYDPTRKWKACYFTDPYDLSPSFNSLDTTSTSSIIVPKTWSKKECNLLKDISDEVRTDQSETSNSSEENNASPPMISDSMIDFDTVAARMQHENSSITTRSSIECRNKFLYSISPNINHSKWTKDESLSILQLVHTQNNHPAWDDVALKLGANRTPWQCFSHYQTNLNPNVTTWSKEENELLLKYIAYKGPSFLIDKGNSDDICRTFFPSRAISQILNHSHASLVNPNIYNDLWSECEERKLILCMKIYKNTPSAIIKASMLYTNRSPKSVSDKWNRCLNPKYDTTAFKPEEDEEILSAVNLINSDGNPNTTANWADMSRSISTLSKRKPAMLSRRWMDIAPESDVLERYQNNVKLKHAVKKRMVIGKSNGDSLLCPNDFVIRVKKDP